MRRRRILAFLGIASGSLLHGCADHSAPTTSNPQPSVRGAVVVATHFEPLPAVHIVRHRTPSPPALLTEQAPSYRRLPPVTRTADAMPAKPSRRVAQRTFERLPAIDQVGAAEGSPHAIDLTENQHPTSVASSRSSIPTDRSVPERRSTPAQATKPPLPPIPNRSSGASHKSDAWRTTGSLLDAVSQRAEGMVDQGFLLAEKGAFYSAKNEFQQALRTVSQALDAHYGGKHHSEALAAGWLSLEEADDFSAHSQRGPIVDVGLIVDSHQTPILKQYALEDVSPVLAMQHYFAFAQEQLVEACGGAPVASRALHGLGKVHMVLGEKSTSAERLHGPKAMAFQQAALTTDPENFLAANELGVLLARFGKLEEARTMLQYSLDIHPLSETWQNLAVVHQRLGAPYLAAQSLANSQLMVQRSSGASTPQVADARSLVQWVPAQVFAGQQPGAWNAHGTPAPIMQHEQAEQAARKTGFLWW